MRRNCEGGIGVKVRRNREGGMWGVDDKGL